jgi:DNA polymerase-3 subunit delta'
MNRLPATIRSRCQKVRLMPLAEPVIRKVLEEQAEVPRAEAQMLAALSSGSLGRALEMRETDIVSLRNESLDLFAVATRGTPADLWKASQGFMRYGRTGREALRRMLEFQRLWLRDLLRARYGAPKELLANQDREREIQRLAPTLDATEIRRRLMVVEEMLRSIEGNITADLTLFSGLARVAGTRFAEGDWPVHGTGRWEY